MFKKQLFSIKTKKSIEFQRGYLLTDSDSKLSEKVDAIQHWHRIDFSNYTLRYCPLLPVSESIELNVQIIMLGYAMNPYRDINNNLQIVEDLQKNLNNSYEDFYNYLDEITGRFVLVVIKEDEHFILQDASGLRTAFYNHYNEPLAVAAHPGLLGEIFDYTMDPLALEISESPQYHLGGVYLPGIMSPYQEVKQLLANTQYSLSTRKVKRFFPRHELGSRVLDKDFLEDASAVLRHQNKMLFERFNVALSLTAGMDSRFSLAVAKEQRSQLNTFTYTIWGNRSHRIDAEVASALSEKYGFHHERIVYSRKNGNDEVASAISRNHGGIRRGPAVHEAFKDFFPEEMVNLRSSLSEIFRCFWQKNPVNRNAKLPLEKMLNLYKKSIKELCREPWLEFIEVQQFPHEKIHGYDPIDLFYWEHRMSNWFSQVLLDADTSHESFIHFNNRKLLISFLEIPFEDRLQDKIPELLIKHNWPDLMELPINPESFSKTDIELKE